MKPGVLYFSRRWFFGENIRAVLGQLWRGHIKALRVRIRNYSILFFRNIFFSIFVTETESLYATILTPEQMSPEFIDNFTEVFLCCGPDNILLL